MATPSSSNHQSEVTSDQSGARSPNAAAASGDLDYGLISGRSPSASEPDTASVSPPGDRSPRTFYRRDMFFDSWSEAVTEPKRQELNQKIKIAEGRIRQARARIAAIPRQVEETDHLLKFLRANLFIHDAIVENGPPLSRDRDTDANEYAALVQEIEQTQESLSKILQNTPGEQQQLDDAEPFVFEALKLAEEFVNHIETQAETRRIAADSALQEQVDQISADLTQQINHIRNSFEPDRNDSVLDEELNRLQLLLHTIRYEVNTHHQLGTLKRLEAVIEEISETVKSIHADQRSVFSLVSATEISVDRWLHRFYFEIPGLRWLPTGWILGFLPNRYRDLRRLFQKMSGTEKDYSARSTTTKGRILAGLTVSLIGWLSITFLISSGVLLARLFLQSVTAGRADRIQAANADLDDVTQSIQDIINTSTISQSLRNLSNLPENNAIAVQNSRQQIGQLIEILELFSGREELCDPLINNSGGDTLLIELIEDCRNAINGVDLVTEVEIGGGESISLNDFFSNVPNTPVADAENAAEIFEQRFFSALTIALDDLAANAQLDTVLRAVSPANLEGIDALSQQIEGQIEGLKGNPELAYVLKVLEGKSSNLQIDEIDGELEVVFDDGNGDRQSLTDEQFEFNDEMRADLRTAFAEAIRIKRNDDRFERLTNEALRWIDKPIYVNNINRLLLALLAGALGGMVSVLTRIEAVEKEYAISSPFLYGLLQPLIGAAFSLIVMMVLSTDLVEVIKVLPREFHLTNATRSAEETLYIQNEEGRFVEADTRPLRQEDVLTTEEVFVILVAGFIVGFSERIAKNAFVTVSPDSSMK